HDSDDNGPSGDHNDDGHPDNGQDNGGDEGGELPPPPPPESAPGLNLTNTGNPPVNTLGLFQNGRYIPETQTGGGSNNGNLVSLGRANMFLLQSYGGWTQRILQMAFSLYNERKSDGYSDENALRSVGIFLKEAGMDREVATALLSQIQQGALQVEKPVQLALEALVK
ncbi:MAG TPA: hypothetical protein V6C52_02980, partial [Coleofasciculaceae cyanobacterium]